MLSTLRWPGGPMPGMPIGRKAQIQAQQPYAPRTFTVQAQTALGPSNSQTLTYSISATTYGYDKARFPQPHTTQTVRVPASSRADSATSSNSMSGMASLTSSRVAQHTVRELNHELNSRNFKIYPNTRIPDTFIYERSDDSRSDTLTSYSSASSDSFASSSTASSATATERNPRGPGNQTLPPPLTPTQHANRPTLTPRPLSVISSSANGYNRREEREASGRLSDPETASARPNSLALTLARPRTESIVHQSPLHSRDGYASDSTMTGARTTGSSPRERERTARPSSSLSARDITPPRVDDPRIDSSRTRRLSVIGPPPSLHERHSPPRHSPPESVLSRTDSYRNAIPGPSSLPGSSHMPRAVLSPERPYSVAPSETIRIPSRDRPSPDRERPNLDFPRTRRMSNGTMQTPNLNPLSPSTPRAPGPMPGPMPSRDRVSPPLTQLDAIVSQPFQTGAPENGGRSLAELRGRSPPRQIMIASAQMMAPSRSVRFSDNLICPSPIPPSRRRKGWYNKRGDQLFTNDGQFLPSEQEYPPDLDEYPDYGVGWMNEEGIRIDMEHRLIPKGPLRPALKRNSTSNSSGSSGSKLDTRVGYPSSNVRPPILE